MIPLAGGKHDYMSCMVKHGGEQNSQCVQCDMWYFVEGFVVVKSLKKDNNPSMQGLGPMAFPLQAMNSLTLHVNCKQGNDESSG